MPQDPQPRPPFEYVRPTPASVDHITAVRTACDRLYQLLLRIPPCRERSLAVTKLEEASMWANKAIVFTQKED